MVLFLSACSSSQDLVGSLHVEWSSRLEEARRGLGGHVKVLLDGLILSDGDGLVALLLEAGHENPELLHGLVLRLLGVEASDGGREVSHLDCR